MVEMAEAWGRDGVGSADNVEEVDKVDEVGKANGAAGWARAWNEGRRRAIRAKARARGGHGADRSVGLALGVLMVCAFLARVTREERKLADGRNASAKDGGGLGLIRGARWA